MSSGRSSGEKLAQRLQIVLEFARDDLVRGLYLTDAGEDHGDVGLRARVELLEVLLEGEQALQFAQVDVLEVESGRDERLQTFARVVVEATTADNGGGVVTAGDERRRGHAHVEVVVTLIVGDGGAGGRCWVIRTRVQQVVLTVGVKEWRGR